jgi:hypothetical protein
MRAKRRPGGVKRRFQIIALSALFVLTLIISFALPPLVLILLFGWAVAGLWDEQVANLSLWQFWPFLLIFLILGVVWWGMIVWIRRL